MSGTDSALASVGLLLLVLAFVIDGVQLWLAMPGGFLIGTGVVGWLERR